MIRRMLESAIILYFVVGTLLLVDVHQNHTLHYELNADVYTDFTIDANNITKIILAAWNLTIIKHDYGIVVDYYIYYNATRNITLYKLLIIVKSFYIIVRWRDIAIIVADLFKHKSPLVIRV